MRFIRHIRRGASVSYGSVGAQRIYGLDGSEGSHSRASELENMIMSGSGAVEKRPGYVIDSERAAKRVYVYESYGGRTVFYLNGSTLTYVTDGNEATYDAGFSVEDMRALQWDTYMFFFGGGGLITADMKHGVLSHWCVGGCGGGYRDAYLPTLYIGCSPDGAGASYEAVNLLCDRVAEQFQGDGQSREFTVHLDGDSFEAYVKAQDGSWERVALVSHSKRIAELESAPPKPDIVGEDNVRIVYTRPDFLTRLADLVMCTCGAAFGVDGHRDRVFLSGNKARPGRVYYSHMDNPLYFADLDYIKVGDSETDVYALSREGDRLCVITDSNIYMVKGTSGEMLAVVHDALFVTDDIFPTPTPVGNTPPVIFMGEPIYLTRSGITAISPSGVLDERCADVRSERLNRRLLNERLDDMEMTVWGDYLVISNRRDTLYLLDGRHYTTSGFSRRYEGYVWTGITAKCLFTEDGELMFSDGERICRFIEGAYADERERGSVFPIECFWESDYLYPSDFKDFKFYTEVGVRTRCNSHCDMRILVKQDGGEWETVRGYGGELCFFYYGRVDYESFTLRPCAVSEAVSVKLRKKRGQGIAVRFENDKLFCNMAIVAYNADYTKM